MTGVVADEALSVNWVRHHRRSTEIARVLRARAVFVRGGSRILPIRYVQQWVKTARLLDVEKPRVVVVMQPPAVALLAAIPYVARNNAVLIGDLHSGVFFDRRWAWASGWVMRRLRQFGGAVVPNQDLAAICEEAGVSSFVCHGEINELQHDHSRCEVTVLPSKDQFVLVPFSYAFDEPVRETLEAASSTPDVQWVFTGRPPKWVREAAPANVHFVGFVSEIEYLTLRHHAAAVLALTTADSTMQSAGYEAMATGTPLITVPTAVLRDYFEDGATYTNTSSSSIACATVEVLRSPAEHAARMIRRRAALRERQESMISAVEAWITSLEDKRSERRRREQ